MTWEIIKETDCGKKLEAVCSCGFKKDICKRTYKRGLTKRCKSCGSSHNRVDLVGKVFDSLTVVEEIERGKYNQRRWLCECTCGNMIEARQDSLVKTQGIDLCKVCKIKRKNKIALCALTSHRLYNTWTGMKARCYNPNATDYKYWGGKGIKVCERWLESFENFLEDMQESHEEGKTLDRIDGNKDYCKSNCRWATAKEQANNKCK